LTVPGTGQVNALTAPATVNRPGDVVSDAQTFYDNPALASTWPQPADSTVAGMLGQAPVHGNVSEERVRSSYSGTSQWQVTAATVYDDDSTTNFYPVGLGRATDVYDALGHKTHSDYTVSSANGLTTGVTTTNPLGQVTATTIDTARGLPLTTTDENTWANNVKNKTSKVTSTLQHDGLGRTIAVWTNERPTTAPANSKYTYQISNTAPTVVTTQTMNDSLGYITSTGIFDALMRQRQTQRETPQGGRMVTDNYYDTHGWLWKTNSDWWDPATTPNATLAGDGTKPDVTDATMPIQSVRAFDGHGRPVLTTSYGLGQVKELSATQYDIPAAGGGDKTVSAQLDPVSNQPFTGSPVRATVEDALGRTTELDDYTTLPSVTITQPTSTVPVTTVAFSGGSTTAGNGNQQVIQYGYDNLGRQNDVHNLAVDQHWRTTYNMLGEPLTKQDPDAGATSNMLYDAVGHLLQSTDANTSTLSYTYDQLGRKTAEFAAPVSAQTPAAQTAAWYYDNSNAVASVNNPIGHMTTSIAFGTGGNTTGAPQYTTQVKGFNVFGEATGQTITIPSTEGALAGSYAFSQLYSANTGLPTTEIYPATANGSLPQEGVTTGYKSKLDLPASLTGSVQYSVDTSYTAYAQIGQVELGTNTVNAYLSNTYDPHTGALTDTKLANTNVSSTPIDETSYQYDAAGNPVSQTEVRGGSTTETQCFGYDTLDRLHQAWTTSSTAGSCSTDPSTNAGATVASGTGGAYWTSWQLDPLGRRTTETDHGLGGAADSTTNYVYNYSGNGTVQPDALTSATTTSGPSTVSSTSFAFDAVGNNTQRVTRVGNQATTSNMSWTPQGKLSGVNPTTGGPSYVYDSDGSLLLQKDPGQTVLYLPGEQLSLANGTVSTTRFYSLPGGGQAVRTSATSYSFQTGDRHGTVGLTIDPAFGTPVWRQQTPYGAPRGSAPSSWPDNLGFLNKPQDTSSGLTMVGARWYDPVLGQFASLDPKFEATDAQQQNGYGYAGENPISSSDPTGLARGCHDDTPQTCSTQPDNPDGSCTPNQECTGDTIMGQGGKDNGPSGYNPAPIPPPPPPVKHAPCDWICSGLGWVEKHAAPITATVAAAVAGGVCLAATGGAGSIACAAAAGAVYNVTDYAMSTPPSQWDAGAMLKTAVTGAVIGAATEFGLGLVAAVARPLLRPLGRLVAPLARAALERGSSMVESLGGLAKSIFSSTKSMCFVAGTKVAVEGGSKNIEDIKVGDKVWSEDPVTGKRVLKAVVQLFQHQTSSLVVLNLAGHQIKVTPQHVLWVAGRGWIEAGRVKPGDHMLGFNGEPEKVDSVDTEDTSTTVYNFEVADTHTYFVLAGDTPVLVHNSCPEEIGPSWFPKGAYKIPKNWVGPMMTKKFRKQGWDKAGFIWRALKGQDSVRIDKGNPLSQWESQQVDHVIVNSGGRVIGRDGNPISQDGIKADPEAAHIPLSEWLDWENWNSPN
jgi:RHS repeat-associated protein